MSAAIGRDTLAVRLTELLGAESVITEAEELAFYSADVYTRGVTAALAIRPQDRASLPAAIKAATERGYAIVTRGGGMSYTGGYLPRQPRTLLVDLSALNKIIEINAQDMVITVEAGVTWKQIWDALRPQGLRLPFFGTFSGSRATVGGGLSNGALFMGTARHGTAAEIVLGMEIISADGTLIRTGQSAFHNGRPGFRNYGPDLTGLFVHDAGTLGVKTLASLRLRKQPQAQDFASFAFHKAETATATLSDLARSGLAEEAYIFDPATTRRSLDPATLKRDLERLGAVIREQGALGRGLREGARMIKAGRGFAASDMHTLHFVCAGRSRDAARADLEAGRELALAAGGMEIANTIPKAARANPFEPLNGILGSQGERWAALNAKVPHSDAGRLIKATEQLLAPYSETMTQHGVTLSFLFIAINNHIFSYEPVLRWFDEWLPVHKRTPEPEHLARLKEPSPDPAARALVDEIRSRIVSLFAEFGAASNQIGKTYPHLSSLNPASRGLLRAIKSELDPNGLMNPGALGDFSS